MSDRGHIRVRVAYSGRVQGVGFRATCVGIAQSYAVTGWVRNEPDGRVLLEVQGAAAVVEAFLAEVGLRLERFVRQADRALVPVVVGESFFRVER